MSALAIPALIVLVFGGLFLHLMNEKRKIDEARQRRIAARATAITYGVETSPGSTMTYSVTFTIPPEATHFDTIRMQGALYAACGGSGSMLIHRQSLVYDKIEDRVVQATVTEPICERRMR